MKQLHLGTDEKNHVQTHPFFKHSTVLAGPGPRTYDSLNTTYRTWTYTMAWALLQCWRASQLTSPSPNTQIETWIFRDMSIICFHMFHKISEFQQSSANSISFRIPYFHTHFFHIILFFKYVPCHSHLKISYCGWLRIPAPPKTWLKPNRWTIHQLVQDFFHPQYPLVNQHTVSMENLQCLMGKSTINPRWSMYGIFTNIDPINDPNVGKYSIHGSSGNGNFLYHVPCHFDVPWVSTQWPRQQMTPSSRTGPCNWA